MSECVEGGVVSFWGLYPLVTARDYRDAIELEARSRWLLDLDPAQGWPFRLSELDTADYEARAFDSQVPLPADLEELARCIDADISARGILEKVKGIQNWIDRLPAALKAAWHRSIVYRAAVHMVSKGMRVGMAIASAINWARHICRTGDVKQWKGPQTVRPSSVAECCAFEPLWAAMRAAAKAS